MQKTWIKTSEQLPRRGQKVVWISPNGMQETGTYEGGAVWFPKGSSMYVYYTPQFWMPVNEG
jgi:hypothetical protein